jgi:predicted esterase
VSRLIPAVAALCVTGALPACAPSAWRAQEHSTPVATGARRAVDHPARVETASARRPPEPEAPPQDDTPSRAAERSGGWTDLSVPGFEPAVLWVPDPGAGPSPVLVVAHGAGGHARWHCELYAERMHAPAYILCPRGVRMVADRNLESGYYFPNHYELEREVMAGLEALWSKFADAARTSIVYAGYSQGATMGALMIVEHADLFHRLVLVEGGTGEWNLTRAERFRRRGGQRILFACGRQHCLAAARRSAHWLERAGLAVRVVYARGAGHTPAGGVGERVAEAFDWLTEGDSRWQSSP